jgi:hypothetical protein
LESISKIEGTQDTQWMIVALKRKGKWTYSLKPIIKKEKQSVRNGNIPKNLTMKI